MGKKVIKIKKLFKKFSKHVASCESARFVCTTQAAFESWFRVELNPVLWKLGYPFEDIDTKYTYPDSTKKADLCIRTPRGDIVFELKSFVKDQDVTKKNEYPKQIARLEELIHNSGVLQVITFTSFIGYRREAIMQDINRWFQDGRWNIIEPAKLIKRYPLHVAITSMTR